MRLGGGRSESEKGREGQCWPLQPHKTWTRRAREEGKCRSPRARSRERKISCRTVVFPDVRRRVVFRRRFLAGVSVVRSCRVVFTEAILCASCVLNFRLVDSCSLSCSTFEFHRVANNFFRVSEFRNSQFSRDFSWYRLLSSRRKPSRGGFCASSCLCECACVIVLIIRERDSFRGKYTYTHSAND